MKNCPEGHYGCEGCWSLIDGNCTYAGGKVNILDVMTHSELVKFMNPEPKVIPTENEIHRLTVLINDLENRLNVHIDNSKVMAKKRGKKEQF